MENQQPEEIDIESLMAAMRPPSNPDETFNRDNVDLDKIKTWNKSFAVSVLAGLSTEPAFHANGTRLDWLQRLVLSKSQGQRKPPSAELSRALNAGLDRASVLRLEDPIEDLFCDLIATPHGNYRIFPGQWEAAAAYTQTLLDAFESLPPSSRKRDVLESIRSLLRLSDEIAERANVHRFSEYRGRMVQDSRGRDKPDKMLRHIRRVQYLRQRSSALCGRLKLVAPPEVRGLLIVDAPQPMNFYMLEQLEDGESAFLDAIDSFSF